MRNYLILKERVAAFRADPEVATALSAARVDELSVPTLGPDESLDELRAEEVDVETLATRGWHFEYLDQLAMEHLLGVRR
jgi:xylose isomerase